MAKKPPFEKIFPYFSYRWRYNDGQYSVYAPFTKAQFVSKDADVSEYFKKGHNTSISNSLQFINLGNISRGGPDVVAIDILYRESISSTVYVLQTIEIPVEKRGYGYETVKVTERSFGSALPADQLGRHFDNVPRKAKSQEITANRLMYGNYLQKYDIAQSLDIKVDVMPVTQPHNGPSVKTNRTYEVGVAYLDKYGRLGNILTQKTEIGGGKGSSFTTDFNYKNRISLTAKIESQPPAWAKYYRYYVKDVSGEHFNLTAFNVYDDGEGLSKSDNVYLQFNSKERNKITEDTILIPKRYNFENEEVIFDGESRHPVLEIENEAPDIVKSQITERSFAYVAQFLETNASLRPISVSNGQNDSTSDNHATTTVGQTTLIIEDEKADGWLAIISAINQYVASQDPDESLRFEQKRNDSGSPSQGPLDVSGYSDRLALKVLANKTSDEATYQTGFVLVDSIELMRINGDKHRNAFKFVLSNRVDEDGNILNTTGLDKGGINMHTDGISTDIRLSKLGLAEEGFDKIKGSFFVKVPREVANNTSVTDLPTGQISFDDDGRAIDIKELNFETEPLADSNLDLYWEDGQTRDIAKHGDINHLEWSNCIASKATTNGNTYLESLKIFDKFNSVEIAKGTRVLTPDNRYAEERRKSGLIFSGLYNSKTGINELNQFNDSLGITKELEPNYGGIQKLFTLDTNLLAFTEDKVFRILADKDALFNADDGVNVTATNRVLGQAMAYQGNYGISTHPESAVYFRNNIYFTDAKRGVVMQLTPANGQLFPISSRGMANFFRDRISSADKLIGAYDGAKKQYVLSMQGYDPNSASIGSETISNETSDITLGYSLRAEAWSSRFSFIPESGLTMDNHFYTFKNGKAYLHNSDTVDRNNFYGTAYDSNVQVILNDNPTYVSDYLTLNYEGDADWEASEIVGDQDGVYSINNVRILDSDESGFLGWFLKEGKYHGAIVGTQPVYIIDPAGTVGADGFWPLIQDGANTQDVSGTKGFFAKVRFKTSATTKKELFAISSEYYISQT